MKPRHVVMAMGLVGAGWLTFFGDDTQKNGIAEPVIRPIVPTQTTAVDATPGLPNIASAQTDNIKRAPFILALLPRDPLIGKDARKPTADGIFGSQTWAPPPPPPPKPLPPPPPSAPPLPFIYLGKKAEDNQWEVYLARNEQTFIVREHAVIEGTYLVDSIKPPILSVTYLPLKQVQTLAIGGTD